MPADWSPAKCRPKDLGATRIKTHGQGHHDHKRLLNIDMRHKIIRKIVIYPANTRRDVYADRGYPSGESEARLTADGYRNRIQREGHWKKPLS